MQQPSGASRTPAPVAKRGIPIDLFFRGSDLLKADVLSDSDPYLILYEIAADAPQASADGWLSQRKEVGRTETIDDDLNPVWMTSIAVRYVIGASQRFLCRLIDHDGLSDDRNDPLGDASFYLSDVMNAPNYAIMIALPTQGSVIITARISLRRDGMTVERIPIPRCATVVDALQKSTSVTETGTTDISFPASAEFWKALHNAVALAPSSAQAPPHLYIESAEGGDGILVNKVFLIDFLDQCNESVTHTLTLTVGDGSRAFRAVPAMWERLLAFYAGGVAHTAPVEGEPMVTVESNHDPHRRKVRLPWSSWTSFTKLWDAKHEGGASGDTFGHEDETMGTAAMLAGAGRGGLAGGRGGGVGDGGDRTLGGDLDPLSHAATDAAIRAMYPQWTDRSQRMPCSTALGRPRNSSSTGTYWTNFMREWSVLQAAARNHLPSGG
jgi:hypothetical protein